jgi:hypothetical protein
MDVIIHYHCDMKNALITIPPLAHTYLTILSTTAKTRLRSDEILWSLCAVPGRSMPGGIGVFSLRNEVCEDSPPADAG